MPKPLTIRTEEATLKRLDALAAQSKRSRNYVANRALEVYLAHAGAGEMRSAEQVPVVTQLSDLGGDVWLEDDAAEFEAYLRRERLESLESDAGRDRY